MTTDLAAEYEIPQFVLAHMAATPIPPMPAVVEKSSPTADGEPLGDAALRYKADGALEGDAGATTLTGFDVPVSEDEAGEPRLPRRNSPSDRSPVSVQGPPTAESLDCRPSQKESVVVGRLVVSSSEVSTPSMV